MWHCPGQAASKLSLRTKGLAELLSFIRTFYLCWDLMRLSSISLQNRDDKCSCACVHFVYLPSAPLPFLQVVSEVTDYKCWSDSVSFQQHTWGSHFLSWWTVFLSLFDFFEGLIPKILFTVVNRCELVFASLSVVLGSPLFPSCCFPVLLWWNLH